MNNGMCLSANRFPQTIADQIQNADVAIAACESLNMPEVGAQIIAKRAALVRRQRSPIRFEVEYHTVLQRPIDGYKHPQPTVLPTESVRDEVKWFKSGMENVTVSVIRWGDCSDELIPESRPPRHRVMLTGKDPVNGSLIRAYVYAVPVEVTCPRCQGGTADPDEPGYPCMDCEGFGVQGHTQRQRLWKEHRPTRINATISEIRAACGEFDCTECGEPLLKTDDSGIHEACIQKEIDASTSSDHMTPEQLSQFIEENGL